MPARSRIVVVPTYNEADNIRPLTREILDRGFDLLVVDDGSPDGTGAIADELAREHPGSVHVIHRSGKLGLGTAYVVGFTRALSLGYRRIFQMDADFSHDPADLLRLDEALNHADVVLGTRWMPKGGVEDWPFWRQALSRGGSIYASLVLGLPYRDLTGGFKGWRSHVLERIRLETIKSNGYAFQIEMTHRAFQAGSRIVEIPIRFADRRRGVSKMSSAIIGEAFVLVWKLRSAQLPREAPALVPEAAPLVDDSTALDRQLRHRPR